MASYTGGASRLAGIAVVERCAALTRYKMPTKANLKINNKMPFKKRVQIIAFLISERFKDEAWLRLNHPELGQYRWKYRTYHNSRRTK